VAQANQARTTPDSGNTAGGIGGSYAPIDMAPGYDILTMAAIVVVGIAAFLFISTGSWQEAKKKLKNFVKYEFANFFGPRKKRKE
jgi:stage II sporulation protein P